MAITVRQLVGIPDLGTRVYAGATGIDREITWAHVSELPDPTEWLDSGELLMTTGLAIAEEPSAQRAYVERLANAGVSGLLIGERMEAPDLSDELAWAAEELSFPVLMTAYEVPFTAIARAVADANTTEQRQLLARTQQIYETVRSAAAAGLSGAELMARLGELVGCGLYVVDPERGFSLLPGTEPPSDVVATLTAAASVRAKPIPALLRLERGSRPAVAMAVPASRPAAMIVLPRGQQETDLTVLRHVTSVAALEVEKETSERERRRRLGSELLGGLLDGRVSPESAGQALAERGLGEEPRVLAACSFEGREIGHSDLHLRLEDQGVSHLLLRRTSLLTVLVPDTPEAIEALREEIDSSVTIGVSDRLRLVSRLQEALRESRWALEGAKAAHKPLVRYGEDTTSHLFLPRTLSEADTLVKHVLGDLIDYDTTHSSCLVESLDSFLSHNRSWKNAAASLHIHKQTLVYRMRRIEEITGRNLNRTDDIVELWLALRAHTGR
ncbi:MAG: PucR family transcriptional regulator [Streptosporangiales bacterium]|nr:PucR family transcriptional regulator [Streptosporangiales bacterium]